MSEATAETKTSVSSSRSSLAALSLLGNVPFCLQTCPAVVWVKKNNSSKNENQSVFTHPHVAVSPYAVIISAEHTGRIFMLLFSLKTFHVACQCKKHHKSSPHDVCTIFEVQFIIHSQIKANIQKILWLSNQLYSVPLAVEVAFIDILNYILFIVSFFILIVKFWKFSCVCYL